MPYDRNEVVTSVSDFYTFLSNHLHFQPAELKPPPPSGWPKISQSRLDFLGKSDKVIDLLQHMPYLPPGSDNEKHIFDYTVCVDYNDECVDLHEQKPKLYVTGFFEPEDEVAENSPYEPFKERYEDVAVIGKPFNGDTGCFIFLDTRDGEVAIWDVMDNCYDGYGSAKECFADLKRRFEEIELFPTYDGRVFALHKDRYQGLKDVIRSFGWPPTDEDGKEWKREECLKEVERTIYDY